jgi:hypothetical protein
MIEMSLPSFFVKKVPDKISIYAGNTHKSPFTKIFKRDQRNGKLN